MSLLEIQFRGLIGNMRWEEIGGPKFQNALHAVGWSEGITTHFFKELCKDGPTRGVLTPNDLARAIRDGFSAPGVDGKTLHWVCQGRAKIVYNAKTKTLITFTQGDLRT